MKKHIEKIKLKTYDLLRWMEQWTGTDMIYLASGTFWLQIARGGSMLLSLASSIIFANILLPETYGNYRYILSIFSYLTIFTLAGMDNVIVTAAAQKENKTILTAIKEKIKYGYGGLVVGLAIAAYYLFNQNTQLAGAVLITSLFIPFFDPLFSFMSILNGHKDYKLQTKYGLIIRFVATTALIATVYISKNILVIIAVYFLSNFIPRMIFYKKVITPIAADPIGTEEETKNRISFGKHLSLMGVIGQISVYLDQILVYHFNNAAVLAGYYLSMMPFKQIQTLVNSVNVLALPKFSQNSLESIKKNLLKKIVKMYAIIIPTIAIYFLLADFVFQKIYPKYMDSVFLSKIFILQLLYFPLTLLSTAFTAHGKQKELYIGTTSYAIVRVALILLLTPKFGIYGAAAAILITGASNGLLYLYMFFKK